MEHHLTLETGNYFLLGISPSVHFFSGVPYAKYTNIFCPFATSSSRTLGSVTQNMSSPQNLQTSDSSPPKSSITPIMSIFDQKPFRFLHVFFYKEFFICNVPSSQQVHRTHAKIVVMMQLDTSINT